MVSPRLVLVFLATLVPMLSVGCVQYDHYAFSTALHDVDSVSVRMPARSKVYTFLMNGANLFETTGLDGLRKQLVEAGYPKFYYAQQPDYEWYHREIFRMHRDEPEARFVLVGYGSAAERMVKLTRELMQDGIPLDAVIFLDPVGVNCDFTECTNYRTITVTSHHWRLSPGFRTLEKVEMVRVGHLSLPSSPAFVGYMTDLLTAIASTVRVPQLPSQCPPITEKANPIPRPDVPMQIRQAPPEWQFLCPPGGNGISNCLQQIKG